MFNLKKLMESCCSHKNEDFAEITNKLKKQSNHNQQNLDKEKQSCATSTAFEQNLAVNGLRANEPISEKTARAYWHSVKPDRRKKRATWIEEHPSWGYESDCLQSFLTQSARRRALEKYFLANQRQHDHIAGYYANEYWRSDMKVELVDEDGISQPIGKPGELAETSELTPTQAILLELAQDDDSLVRLSVATNENTPEPAMWILHEDEVSDIRYGLACNAKCPVSILDRLASDKDERIAVEANAKLRKLWSDELGIASGNLSAAYGYEDKLASVEQETMAEQTILEAVPADAKHPIPAADSDSEIRLAS